MRLDRRGLGQGPVRAQAAAQEPVAGTALEATLAQEQGKYDAGMAWRVGRGEQQLPLLADLLRLEVDAALVQALAVAIEAGKEGRLRVGGGETALAQDLVEQVAPVQRPALLKAARELHRLALAHQALVARELDYGLLGVDGAPILPPEQPALQVARPAQGWGVGGLATAQGEDQGPGGDDQEPGSSESGNHGVSGPAKRV